ncbi:MAG: hypothetical protein F7B60_04365 [Desulfurococcales archaeon]|nr:hypothetical protein [Desulfurococcales archaeon]
MTSDTWKYIDTSRVSPREAIIFSRLIETYAVLQDLEGKVRERDLNLICESIGICTGTPREPEKLNDPEALIEQGLSILGLRYGDCFRRRDVYRSPDPRKSVSLFVLLKRLGVIRETRSGLHRVLDKREIQRLVKQFRRNNRSLNKIVGESQVGWSRDDLLMEAEIKSDLSTYLSYMDNKKLLDVLSARIRKRDWKTTSKIIKELNSRINKLSSREISRLAHEVENNPRIADNKLLENLLKRKPSLTNKLIRNREKAKAIGNQMQGTELAAGYTRNMGGSPSFSTYLRRYLETGNLGYLDMALSSVREDNNYPLYDRLVKYIETGEDSEPIKVLSLAYSLLYPETDVIASIISSKSVKRRLLHFLQDRILVEAKAGRKKTSKKTYTDSGNSGRLDVRRSSFRLARFHNKPLLYRRNVRKHGAILVVDTSGSLSQFSGEVILYSSLFSKLIETLVVFSDKSQVFKCRKKCRIDSILDKLAFGGNTNLVNALETAFGLSRYYRKIIVISDLKHNVSDKGLLVKRVGEILARQRKIVFLLVGDYDKRTSAILADTGAKLIFPGDVRRLKRILYRELLSH